MRLFLVCCLFVISTATAFAKEEVLFTARTRLPNGCRSSGKAVDCSSSGLTLMPIFNVNTTKVITSLFLKNNSIKKLDVSQRFDEVVLLDVSSCKVETVTLYIGYNFPELRSLRMNGNFIKNIAWLSEFRKLRTLNLRENHIDSLSPNQGQRLIILTTIQEIDLSSNLIADVNPVSKWRMNSLERLNLSTNKITDLRDAHFPPKLLQLDVSRNRITAVYPEFMVSIPRVQWLGLTHNEISTMSFLLQNRSQTLWKVDLAGNNLRCSCALYLQKLKLGRAGVVFGEEPFCSDGSDKKSTSLFAFGADFCPQMVSDMCQDKNAFHYVLQGERLTWERDIRLDSVNISWTMTDESGAEMTSGSASIEARNGHLGSSVGMKTALLCLYLSRGALTCLHSCRLVSSTVLLSSTNQILVVVLAITGACILLLLICFFVRERARCCGSEEPPPQMRYAGSVHSIHPSMHGSRMDMLMETNLDDSSGGMSAMRPVSTIVSNGNQTVPVRHFVRKQPMAGGPVSMHVKRASLFQSERCLTSAASMHSLTNFQSMGRLNSSRQSLASRALPEVPSGSYCDMANVQVGQEPYEFMEDAARQAAMATDTYQELGYQ